MDKREKIKMTMDHKKGKNILVMAICLIMILPQPVFSGDSGQIEFRPGGGPVATKPYIPDEEAKDPDPGTLPNTNSRTSKPSVDLPMSTSPLSPTDDQTAEAVLTEEEARQVLQLLAETLTLAKRDPKLSASDAEKYNRVIDIIKMCFSTQKKAADQSQPTALKAFEDITAILGRGVPRALALGTSASPNPSENVMRQFSDYLVANIQMTREYMAEDMLLPEGEAFSAGESSVVTPKERSLLFQETNHSAEKNYQVLSSVTLNREIAKTHELLNPPQKLQPFLRWLFYGRHLTKERAERYLVARAKVQAIFLRAKAGEGLIRYKGQIVGVFLPLPGDDSGGTFELVRRM